MICLLDTSSWYFFSLFFSSPGNFSWHTRHTGFRSNSKNLVLEQNKFYLSSQSLSLHSNFHVIQDSFYFQYKSASITLMLHRLSYFHVKYRLYIIFMLHRPPKTCSNTKYNLTDKFNDNKQFFSKLIIIPDISLPSKITIHCNQYMYHNSPIIVCSVLSQQFLVQGTVPSQLGKLIRKIIVKLGKF